MSHKLFSTGLFFEDARGWAKLRGVLVYLIRPPYLDGLEPYGIYYVPEIGRKSIAVDHNSSWHDMSRIEVIAADRFLLTLIGEPNGLGSR